MSVGSGYITISRSSAATNFPVWPSVVQLARSSIRIRHSTFTFSDGFAKYRGYLHGIDTFDGCRVRRSEGGGVKRAISTAEFRAWTAAQQNYYFIRGTLLISSVVAIVVSPSWLLSGRVYGSPASNPGVVASHTRWRARTYVFDTYTSTRKHSYAPRDVYVYGTRREGGSSCSRACGTYISTFDAHNAVKQRRTRAHATLVRDICLAVRGGWVELWWTGGWPCGRADDSLFSGLLTGGVFGSYMPYGTLKIAPG